MRTLRTSGSGEGGATREGKTLVDPFGSAALAWDAWQALRGGPGAIKDRQNRRLESLVSFARRCSPFYRNLYADLPRRDAGLSLLPPIDKAGLTRNFDGWVTDPDLKSSEVEAFLADKSRVGQPYLNRYLIWTSSGTTGVPATFVQDERALTVAAALNVVRGPIGPLGSLKVRLRGSRRAVVSGSDGHFQSPVLMEHLSSSNPRWSEKLLVLSALAPLSELVRRLNAFRPAVLGGFASTLSLLAEEQQAGRLRIAPVLLHCGGESLPPEARKLMEAAFGCPARDYYGASEATGLARDCEHGWLHVNADWFVLEPVDEEYRPVPPGEVSHTVLLTNLANRVQPLIRYDLGDRVLLKPDPCPCNNPLPTLWVEGRRNERLSFRSKDGRTVRLPPRALAIAINYAPGVRRCQAIKTGPGELRVRLEPEPGADEEAVWKEARQRVEGYLAGQGLSSVAVQRDPERPGVDPKTGKFRHVWSEEEPAATTW